jgi:Tfp pilus assembly protein PilF
MKGLPGNADGWALLGRAYHYNSRFDEAAEAYKKAVSLTPLNASYRATLGLILGQAGELEEGLAELLKVTATPGYKDAAGWANLGWVYRNMNKAPESIAAYQKALALDPKEEQAALGLGWAHQYTKSYDRRSPPTTRRSDRPKERRPTRTSASLGYFFKRDMAQARVYADKAGRRAERRTQLKENIDKVEKQLAAARSLQRGRDREGARRAAGLGGTQQEARGREQRDALAQSRHARPRSARYCFRGRSRRRARARGADAE